MKNGDLPIKRVVNQSLTTACHSASRATNVHLRTFVKALAALLVRCAHCFYSFQQVLSSAAWAKKES